MRRLVVLGVIVGCAVAAVTVPARASASGSTRCNNQTLGAVTVSGNLVVPAGAFCDLEGTHVTGSADVARTGGLLAENGATIDGSVSVDHNAQFAAFSGATVGGSIECDGCQVADVQDSTVKGSLTDNSLTMGAFIKNSHFGGSLLIRDSVDGGFGFSLASNSVGGNLTFNDNSGSSTISGNTIGHTLSCRGDTPPPTGAGNTAASKKGQCAGL